MVIIIGAGLSGLLTAYRLKKEGISVQVLEARDRVGGRIHTVSMANGTPVEMGATWFHPEDRFLLQLLEELEIPYYQQFMEGRAFYQARSTAAPEEFPLPMQPPSYRISGGTLRLIKCLSDHLEADELILNEPIHQIDFSGNTVVLEGQKIHSANRVILSCPPRLWEQQVKIHPPLPAELLDMARNTHTWMQESVKAALVYPRPFWRERGLSGALFSNEGPMTELYDHCDEGVSFYALCGFVHPGYIQLTPEQRKKAIIDQLTQALGPDAQGEIGYSEVNWSAERFTTGREGPFVYPHQNNGDILYQNSYFEGRLILSGTETSPHRGGYMEGAVYASLKAVAQILKSS